MNRRKKLAVALCAALMFGSIPAGMNTLAAEEKTTDTSWYVKQGENPYKGSCWTFSYYNGTGFQKMEQYMAAGEGGDEAHWRSRSGNAWFAAWYANCSASESAAAVFDPGQPAAVTVRDQFGPKVLGSYQGQFLIAQQNSAGGFYPLYPTRGKWEYQTLSHENLSLEVEAYLAAGDKLYLVYKSADGNWTQITTTPKITYTAADTDVGGLRPENGSFTAWPEKDLVSSGGQVEPPPPPSVKAEYIHSAAFSDKSAVNGPFSYEFGFDGVFEGMSAYYAPWKCWRDGDSPPSVGSYYIGSTTKKDGLIAFTAPQDADIDIGSTLPVKLDKENAANCDGVAFMIVQQNTEGFYPLWPKKGEFDWQMINNSTGELNLTGVTTKVKKGDRILFIARSTGGNIGDVVNIDPAITLLDTSDIVYPSFSAWSSKPITIPEPLDGVYKHSTYFTADSAVSGPFSYRYGDDGKYERMEMFREDYVCWSKSGGGSSVGSYWVSGTTGVDAVIVFTAAKDGMATISSSRPIKLTFPQDSDGAALMVVLKNQNGEHPLWPVKGKWESKEITGDMQLELEEITEYLHAGDEIHFVGISIGSSAYDSTEWNPTVKMDYEAVDPGTMLPAVERVYPTEEELVGKLPIMEGLTIDPPASQRSQGGPQGSGGNLWLIIGLCAGGVLLLAGGTAAVIILVRRRKKKAVAGEGKAHEKHSDQM